MNTFTDFKTRYDRLPILSLWKEQWKQLARIALIVIILGWAFSHFIVGILTHAHRICNFNHTNCVVQL